MNDSDATPMPESDDETTAADDRRKWKDLPPDVRRLASGEDGPPSEYGSQVGVDDHPLRQFYREAEAEDRAADQRNARRIDARHTRGVR